MTKRELYDRILAGQDNLLTKKDVSTVAEAFMAEVMNVIQKEKRFAWPGFGVFTVRTRKARMGINPQTKMPIKIMSSRTVGFKASKSFRKTL